MTYFISHVAALEAMRSPQIHPMLARREPASGLPRKAPGSGEVERWLAQSDIARRLTGPLVLLGAGEAARKKCRGFEVRTASLELPPGSLIDLGEDTAIVSPELLLLQMSRVATPLELAMLVCELCGLYAIDPSRADGLVQREEPLTSLARIEAFLAGVEKAPGTGALRRAAARAFEPCASPQEAKLAARVAWPWFEGGYSIPILGLNESVEVARIARRLADSHVRRPDILLRLPSEGKPGVCLEYHGGNHLEPGRHQADDLRVNELLAHGMKPYMIWSDQYQSTSYMDGLLGGVVRRELGLARHRPGARRATVELARREALLCELNAVDGLSWGTSRNSWEVRAALEAIQEAEERPLDDYA